MSRSNIVVLVALGLVGLLLLGTMVTFIVLFGTRGCSQSCSDDVTTTMASSVTTSLLPSSTVFSTTTVSSGADGDFTEKYRPQFHFSPKKNWINDPNGLVYFRGEYHLFYQYNPEGPDWGYLSWGHSVSKDLIHWEELPVAISYDENEMIFSGSVVIDRNYPTVFGEGAMVAVYTSAAMLNQPIRNQVQSLAYSNDLGRTWRKYENNPVLVLEGTDFRDPKLLYLSKTDEWLMVVAVSEKHQVNFYTSKDFLKWEFKSSFGPSVGVDKGVWECPDLFELPVNGNEDNTKWVLIVSINPGGPNGGSAVQYFVGSFENYVFVPDDRGKSDWLDYGMDYYAAVSFTDAPDNKRIMIGWMSNWLYAKDLPTTPWRNSMSTPRELGLKIIRNLPRLTQNPIPLLNTLRGKQLAEINKLVIKRDEPMPLNNVKGAALDLSFDIDRNGIGTVSFGVSVRVGEENKERTIVGFDVESRTLFVERTDPNGILTPGRRSAPMEYLPNKPVHLRILVDWSSIEVFGNHGEVVISEIILPEPTSVGVELFSNMGYAVVKNFEAWEMKSYRFS